MTIQNGIGHCSTQFESDTLLQIRTGKVKPVFGGESAIYKTPHFKPIKVGPLGCEGDEHAYKFHGGPDKALMHYAAQHYKLWQVEYPNNSHLFTLGGFGENFVTETAHEENICIGDDFQVGTEVIIQVSEPRQPCYKLNRRFEIADMSAQSQNLNRTGWYYRILREGWIQPGDRLTLLQRKHSQWTIKNVQYYLYKDRNNEQAIKELSELPELGQEIKTIFHNRLKKVFLDENRRLKGGKEDALEWASYRLLERSRETSKICSFVFEAVNPSEEPTNAEPGSHIRVKLGNDGRLVRAYSIVQGHSNSFRLGIALDENTSRGGSKYMHDEVDVGMNLIFGEIKSDFPLNPEADRHVFIAGGIGITAFMAAARQLQDQGLDYHLYYAVRCAEDVAFKDLIGPLGSNVTVLDKSAGHSLDIRNILSKANDQTHIYVCGPDRLMEGVMTCARDFNFPAKNIHFEAFTASTSGDPFTAELAESNKTLEVKEDQTLLDVLREAGFDTPSSCEVGNCGTCRVGVRSGRVEHRGTGLMKEEKRAAMLSCVSRGIGNIVLDI